jgi:hypothetical protein
MTTKPDAIRVADAAEDAKTLKTTLLSAIVDQVRRDSKADSEEYLDETTVPHGGE